MTKAKNSIDFKNALDDFCDMLNTYGGRDKVMKALCYSAKLASGLYAVKYPELAKKLAAISSRISGSRATLRLIDDVPMLQYTLEYDFGRNEPDKFLSAIGLISIIVDHLYYPVEKICWLYELNCITLKNPDRWDVISTIFWVSSIYLNLMKTCRSVTLIEQHKRCLETVEHEAGEAMVKLLNTQRMEIISIMRLTMDLTQAVSYLPRGWFWGGRLQTWHVGALGTMSAIIGIYQYFAKKKLTK